MIRMPVAFAALSLTAIPLTHAAAQVTAVEGGVRTKEGDLVEGASVITSYHAYTPAASDAGEDRSKNRAVVARFFELPIGMERAALFAPNGIKQLPALGAQWVGAEAVRRNNAQNARLFPGWAWTNVVIWDTQDPTAFWVEADGHTAPGQTPVHANHYVHHFIVQKGKIVRYREFGAPVTLAK